ncbi:MAG: amidohydrolase family protein, partial [Desulfobacterales bacterium]|nr:amidohydrolase family protein [Desulfobacterales bacterium]
MMNQGSRDREDRLIRAGGEDGLHRAGWVMVDSSTFIENGCVRVKDGRIQDVGPLGHVARGLELPTVDHGPGLLMPPLVNAHTHLELSALKGSLPFDQGFETWVRALLEKREALGESALIDGAVQSLDELQGPVGEISTLGITREALIAAGTSGVFFREYLGPDDHREFPEPVRKDPLSLSHAGHAPHTTAPSLLQRLKKETVAAGLSFSIHVSESDAEMDFIDGHGSQWNEFLLSRGIDSKCWPIGDKSPVAYLDELGILDERTLAVHLLQLQQGDLDILARRSCAICLCPRSNVNLHGRLPRVDEMLKAGLKPALGTDSLASCESLKIRDEMAYLAKRFPGI